MATLTGYYADNEGQLIDKDPEAVLSYQITWTQWLSSGDTIDSSNWTVETISGDTDNITITGNTNTDDVTTVTLTGGTSGNIYKVYNTITTVNSLTDRRYFRVKVKDRTL
jgi:uncharacterized protein (UPF0333 family)|tara:strand:- start:1641 stop:1970 length:330 start_codon:yes stop_codon:yes gene_type:complete